MGGRGAEYTPVTVAPRWTCVAEERPSNGLVAAAAGTSGRIIMRSHGSQRESGESRWELHLTILRSARVCYSTVSHAEDVEADGWMKEG